MDDPLMRIQLQAPQTQRLRARWGRAGAEAIQDGEPLTDDERALLAALVARTGQGGADFRAAITPALQRFAASCDLIAALVRDTLLPALDGLHARAEQVEVQQRDSSETGRGGVTAP